MQTSKSRALFQRAMNVMPYGVNSNYRYFSDEDTLVFSDAKGGYIYDPDGNAFLDYRLGWGPVIVGHADAYINEYVKTALDRGQVYAATHEYEVRVAERIIDLCPGVEMVRLTNSGSEATLHSLRLARGYTGRDLILKFEGSYHGAHDYVLWSTANAKLEEVGERAHPRACKGSIGIPDVMKELLIPCPWNAPDILADILSRHGEKIAAIIMEPMLGNGNAIMPLPGFLESVRAQCDKYGIVLIFDEVKVGFRIAPGGAREYFGVIPDISCYAKAMGNGYPIAAVAGHEKIMMHFGPGKVFQGGTYSGNVVSSAAADATLSLIQKGDVHRQLEKTGNMLMSGFREILSRQGIVHHVHGAPALFGISFSESAPRDWRELLTDCSFDVYESVITYMMEQGILREPFALEPFYLCAAHSEEDAARTLQAFEDGLKKVLSGAYTRQGILPVDADF